MKITERRLRSIIRSVIKENRLDEMMDDMYAGTPHDTGYSGDALSILNQDLPRQRRAAEQAVREALVSLNAGQQIIPQSSWAGIAAVASAFYHNMPTFGAITIGVFIASALFELYVKKRVGAEKLDPLNPDARRAITYLDEEGYRVSKRASEAISDILDKEGY